MFASQSVLCLDFAEKVPPTRLVPLTAIYVGLALPGWIVAARYEPPPPVEEPIEVATAEVTYEQLSNRWVVDGSVKWENNQSLKAPGGATVKLAVGDSVKQGEVIYSSSESAVVAIACGSPSQDLQPGAKGGEFLECLHRFLADQGFPVEGNDSSNNILGTDTRNAVASFFSKINLPAPMSGPDAEQNIEDAEFAYKQAELTARPSRWIKDLTPESKSATLSLERQKKLLQRARKENGVVIRASDWLAISPEGGSVVVAVAETEDFTSIRLGSGHKQLTTSLPAAILQTEGRSWSLASSGHELTEVKFGDVIPNPQTGTPEVPVTLDLAADLAADLEPGEIVSVQLVANDTGKKVLSIPGSALRGTSSEGTIQVLGDLDQWQVIKVSETRAVAGRVVIPPSTDIKAGDVVKLDMTGQQIGNVASLCKVSRIIPAVRGSGSQAGQMSRVLFSSFSLKIMRGQTLAIVGPSGCGKSSLLEILSLLRRPDSGTVEVAGFNIDYDNPSEVNKVRAGSIGFVFQAALLIESQTALQNVVVGLRYAGIAHPQTWDDIAMEALASVGLKDLANKSVVALSGGERQRVSIARALAKKPLLLICDEPTASLDIASANQVVEVLDELRARRSTAVVLATHSLDLADTCESQIDFLNISQYRQSHVQTERMRQVAS